MSSFSNTMFYSSLPSPMDIMALVLVILMPVGLYVPMARLIYFCYGLSRPIPRWQVVMFIMLFITAVLEIADSCIMYASGHHSRLGQEVMADNLNRIMRSGGVFFDPLWLLYLRYLFYHACDLLQTLVFTIAILQSALYSPRDQRVFYWVARVEYTSVGILAIWDLFSICLWPPYDIRLALAFKAISVSMSMIHVVLTIILLAASVRLKIKSNPARDGSKVRTIRCERCISACCERILCKESSDFLCSTGTEPVSRRYNGSLRPKYVWLSIQNALYISTYDPTVALVG